MKSVLDWIHFKYLSWPQTCGVAPLVAGASQSQLLEAFMITELWYSWQLLVKQHSSEKMKLLWKVKCQSDQKLKTMSRKIVIPTKQYKVEPCLLLLRRTSLGSLPLPGSGHQDWQGADTGSWLRMSAGFTCCSQQKTTRSHQAGVNFAGKLEELQHTPALLCTKVTSLIVLGNAEQYKWYTKFIWLEPSRTNGLYRLALGNSV